MPVKNEMAFLVMAAGMGSRYNGLKQLKTFGKRNLTIAEYNMLSAIDSGFTKFFFIIDERFADVFDRRLRKFLPSDCRFGLIFQKKEKELVRFGNRLKPWGTGHAIFCCSKVINCNFCVTNADDLYGEDAISKVADFLKKTDPKSYKFANVAYQLDKTLSGGGTVSRGIIKSTDNKFIESILERTITNDNYSSEEGISPSSNVSMNLWAFTPKIFEIISREWEIFKKNIQNSETDEFYLPNAISHAITVNECRVEILKTSSQWHGVTYETDNALLENCLN